MQNYIIMHMNRKVASIRSDGSCTIYNASFITNFKFTDVAVALIGNKAYNTNQGD